LAFATAFLHGTLQPPLILSTTTPISSAAISMAELRICGNSSRAPQCDSSRTRPRLRASISAPLPHLLAEACTVCAATSPLRQPYMMSCRYQPEGRKLGFLLKLTLNNLVYMSLGQYFHRKTRKI